MTEHCTPKSELERRVAGLQALMIEREIDAVLVLQNADLFYFAGTIQSGCLYVPVDGKPLFMVRRDVERAREESALEEIVPFSSMRHVPGILAANRHSIPGRIGMELDVVPVDLFQRYKNVFPEATFVDATSLIRLVRMKKSPHELALMRAAADQVDKVYRRAAEVIRVGISELELAVELEYTARREGHLGQIRMRVFNGEMIFGHTISGANGAIPAYTDTPLGGRGLHPSFGQGCSRKGIGAREPIIIDFAGSYDGYLVDQTRVFAIEGLDEPLVSGYAGMVAVQDLMTRLAVPGACWSGIYAACLAHAHERGYADYFMGYKNAQVSFIGHGVGIEIDEYPFIAKGFDSMVLEAGMTFAFEPKLVYPGIGAVGIENTFHLSETGLEQLTFSPGDLVVLGG